VPAAVAGKENNILLFCESQQDKFVLKYSLAHLRPRPESRRSLPLDLENEIRFYTRIGRTTFCNFMIPEYVDSGQKPHPWLLLKRLDPQKVALFKPENEFFPGRVPLSFARILVAGVKEFQNVAIPFAGFNVADFGDVEKWMCFSLSRIPEMAGPVRARILEKFRLFADGWQGELRFLAHSDIRHDTVGLELLTNRLVLLDFEKVQVSHRAFDFPTLYLDSILDKRWCEAFLEAIFTEYTDTRFKELFEATLLLQVVSQLEKLMSRRIDYVFLNFVDRPTLEQQRAALIHGWEEVLENLLSG
jgi:hypothetical protein